MSGRVQKKKKKAGACVVAPALASVLSALTPQLIQECVKGKVRWVSHQVWILQRSAVNQQTLRHLDQLRVDLSRLPRFR